MRDILQEIQFDDTGVYRVRSFYIDRKHPLYNYCLTLCSRSNNLYNAAMYRQRQVIFCTKRVRDEWHPSQIEIMDELEWLIRDGVLKADISYEKPWIYAEQMQKWMEYTKNPDYYADGISRQSSIQTLKMLGRDMKSYCNSLKAFAADPSKFKEIPRLPRYKKKGGVCTAVITNQDSHLNTCNKNVQTEWRLKLPFTDIELECGPAVEMRSLKQAVVRPYGLGFRIYIVLQQVERMTEAEILETPDRKNVYRKKRGWDEWTVDDIRPFKPMERPLFKEPSRICCIDPGVGNLMSIVNNCGLPCLIYRGGFLKCINQLYNKNRAEIMSKQTKGTTDKFHETDESRRQTMVRDQRVKDGLHKTALHFCDFCVGNKIDTVVFLHNDGWKQGDSDENRSRQQKINNQNFVTIPFNYLYGHLQYLLADNGIRMIIREESYTSKASFLDRDHIPTYGVDDENASFSGTRGPKEYKGHRKANGSGFRGIYLRNNGETINSDLNGAANGLRKEFPDAFVYGTEPDFNNVIMIDHPEKELRENNRLKQAAKQAVSLHPLSKSKSRRDKKRKRKSSARVDI